MKAPLQFRTSATSSFTPVRSGVLQRKCACGGTPGPSGECAECRRKRLLSPRAPQSRLRVNQPGDRYEQAADRVADRVMRSSRTNAATSSMARVDAPIAGTPVPDEVNDGINRLRGGGAALDPSTRAFMEERMGHDLSRVRVHTDEHAAGLARQLNAVAFTVGHDVVFDKGQYNPQNLTGRRILAHELAHVMQQTGGGAMGIFRLSPAMCAAKADCATPDTAGSGAASTWKVTLAVDREEEGLGRLVSGNVGHTWIKLSSDAGEKFSYGFWPQKGFDPSQPTKSVPGCVHHPDTAHDPPSATDYLDIDYKVTSGDYAKGLAHAESVCKARPDYNLFSYNCTTFAIDVAKAAGISPPSSTTLAIHNPNALYEGIEEEKKKRGASGGKKSGSGSKSGKKSSP